MSTAKEFLVVAANVREALAGGHPVVALETTIVTHGMPHPDNLATARAVEADIRAEGATPATIAVFDGRIHVGLSDDQLSWLAEQKGALKLSRCDLPNAVAGGHVGATTVAATMIAAHLAGIGIFATGGIGGVHRGVEETLDISADLTELARTPVAVVCAGAKGLLDLPRTLEYLETAGVPVIGFGTDMFPAFWCRSSGLKAPIRHDTAAGVARMLAAKAALGMVGGTLIANPIAEADEIPAAEMERHIEAAVRDARDQGVTGKAVTPFLLGRLLELTGGRSLTANISLVRANARLAARIAVAMAAGSGH